jgi:hypothetical protein
MSSFNLVQRPIPNELDVQDTEELAETGGIVFSDGHCLELIRDDATHLSLLDSSRQKGAQRIKYQGRTYVPPIIDASLMEALTLPTRRASGSTADIFTKMCIVFSEHGISDLSSKKLTYWTLSTWFAELFPLAPYLVITGSRQEAHLVLQLLACVVRHGLPLADISLAGLSSLPTHIQPTLLIGHPSPSTWKALQMSSYPRAYLHTKDGVADLYCAKAVYADTPIVDDAVDGAFHVRLAPPQGKPSVVTDLALRNLAADFQPRLVDYRMRLVGQVRDSDFDVVDLGAELRILARVLGSAIVDAPELRADLVNILQDYQEEIRAGDWTNEKYVVIEAMLDHCHSEQRDQLLYVGQLADTANRILKDRGSREKLEPKALGWILRNSMGFTPKRNGRGFAMRLTEDVRRTIHRLARDFQVPTMSGTATACSQCAEILTSNGEEESSNPEIER